MVAVDYHYLPMAESFDSVARSLFIRIWHRLSASVLCAAHTYGSPQFELQRRQFNVCIISTDPNARKCLADSSKTMRVRLWCVRADDIHFASMGRPLMM